jgi:hypothetical protein
MNTLALDFLEDHHGKHAKKPFSLFFAHKAAHPDAEQAADGTFRVDGYVAAGRHRDLYRGCVFPKSPNILTPAEVIKQNLSRCSSPAPCGGAAATAGRPAGRGPSSGAAC